MRCNAVVDHDCKPLAAHTHTETGRVKLQAQCSRIVTVAISQHDYIVADAAVLTPGIHDEDIINCHAGDRIHALASKRLGLLHKAG